MHIPSLQPSLSMSQSHISHTHNTRFLIMYFLLCHMMHHGLYECAIAQAHHTLAQLPCPLLLHKVCRPNSRIWEHIPLQRKSTLLFISLMPLRLLWTHLRHSRYTQDWVACNFIPTDMYVTNTISWRGHHDIESCKWINFISVAYAS